MHACSAYLNGAGETRAGGRINVDDLEMLNTLLTGAAGESASRKDPSDRNEVRERRPRKVSKDVNR
jgi:hypothetical protein